MTNLQPLAKCLQCVYRQMAMFSSTSQADDIANSRHVSLGNSNTSSYTLCLSEHEQKVVVYSEIAQHVSDTDLWIRQRDRWRSFGEVAVIHPVQKVSHDESTHIADKLLFGSLTTNVAKALELATVGVQEGCTLGKGHELEVDAVCEAQLLAWVDIHKRLEAFAVAAE